jgi:hypothetical protein
MGAPLNSGNIENTVAEAQNVIDNYSFVTGGPNQSLINSLTQQSKQKASQYKQNRADAANMYGQLTQTVDEGIQTVQRGYEKNIQDSKTSATGAMSALSGVLQQQVEQRQKAANELGVGKQILPMNFESDTRGNAALGDIAGSQQNWENLLRSQQLNTKQQGMDTKTALGQSRNQTMLALQQALQQGQGNIANQIASERGKQGTQQMTPLGSILLGGIGSKIQGLMNPTNSGAENLVSGLNFFENDPTLIDAMGVKPSEFVNEKTGEAGPNAFYNFYLGRLQQAYSNDSWLNGAPLPPELDRFAAVFKLPRTMITNAAGVFGSSTDSTLNSSGISSNSQSTNPN